MSHRNRRVHPDENTSIKDAHRSNTAGVRIQAVPSHSNWKLTRCGSKAPVADHRAIRHWSLPRKYEIPLRNPGIEGFPRCRCEPVLIVAFARLARRNSTHHVESIKQAKAPQRPMCER